MTDKYNSTDFWYTFLNSLRNFGFSAERGELEMDEEMQEKILDYLKDKIKEGVTDGQTALPPGLHDYFWRFPEEMLPKLRALAEGFLKTEPNNGAAAIILSIVACAEDDSEYLSHIENAMRLVPEDPGIILLVIDKYREYYRIFESDIDWQERALTALENLYAWAKQQDDTVRYLDVKMAYSGQITPYSVYSKLKEIIKELKVEGENPALFKMCQKKIEKCNFLVKKCVHLLFEEQAAFQKELLQESDSQLKIDDPTPENTDFWDAFLDTLENRGLAHDRWKLTQKVQEQLLKYFKMKIEDGVIDGRTTLPSELAEYVQRFPKATLLELREFTEEILQKQPNNGAALKTLAIIVEDNDLPYLEQARQLLSNEAETCFLTISRDANSLFNRDDPLYEKTLSALEDLFQRAQHPAESDLYYWLTKLYNELGKTPCHIYRNLMKNPDANAELIAKCKRLIRQTEQAFQQRLEEEPDDWYALRGLGDIYQTLGQTELAKKYPWEPHTELRWNQEAWVGLQLPNFSATTLDGTPISFSDYHGKLVLLNFCAWWCGPCKHEIPYVKQVYEEHHKNGFETIRISVDEDEADLRKYIEEHEIPGEQIFDENNRQSGVVHYFDIRKVPSMWLIDRDRKIISVDARQDRLGNFVKWTEISRVGNVIPDFSAEDIKGNLISYPAGKGKVVLLFFSNSEQVLTQVDTIYRKYHTKGFKVFGFHPHNALANQFGIDPWRPLPAIVLIDKEGKVITSRYGKVHSPEAWIAKLEKLVESHLELC